MFSTILKNIFIRIFSRKIVFSKKFDFVWMIHPLNLEDVTRRYFFLRFLPESFLNFLLSKLPPLFLSSVDGVQNLQGKKMRGCIMGCFLTSEQVRKRPELVNQKVLSAVKLVNKLGSEILCLGGMLYVNELTEKEIKSKFNINLSNGSALLPVIIFERIKKVLDFNGKKPNDISLSIVNATSFKGKIISRFLSTKEFKNIILLGRNLEHLKELKEEINIDNIKISNELKDINDSDLVLVAPSNHRLEFKLDYLHEGITICDVNTPAHDYNHILKKYPKIKIFKDETVNTKDVIYDYNLGIPSCNSYICLTETYLLAQRDGIKKSFFHNMSPNMVEEIENLFHNSNFFLVDKKYD